MSPGVRRAHSWQHGAAAFPVHHNAAIDLLPRPALLLCVRWEHTLESLVAALEEFEFAILVVTADDMLVSRHKVDAMRDFVLSARDFN
jgi:hypothetical protein